MLSVTSPKTSSTDVVSRRKLVVRLAPSIVSVTLPSPSYFVTVTSQEPAVVNKWSIVKVDDGTPEIVVVVLPSGSTR